MISNRSISGNTYCLRTKRPEVEIRAGQCFSVGTKDLGINREYSMYSGANDDFVDFLVREIPDGIVSPRLGTCSPGDGVEIGGPYGDFCLSDNDVVSRHFVFIATGTGIAPFHSFVKTFPNLDYVLYHGVRFDSEQYDRDDYPSDRYISTVSQPETNIQGQRVTQLLETAALPIDSLYYLCGNRMMITDAISILRLKGIPGGAIFTETFF